MSVQVRPRPLVKTTKQFNLIQSFLEGLYMYGISPSKKEFLNFLQKAKEEKKPVRLMYGETYDRFGMTIDSLKYYFFLSLLHKVLEQEGITVSSTILIADAASVINSSVKDKDLLLQQAENRLDFMQKIIKMYHLPVQPLLMSTLFQESHIQQTIEKVKSFTQKSPQVQQLFAKTVFEYLVAEEKAQGFRYACEEAATSLQFDIKCGPPREQFYDKATQILGPALGMGTVYGIYLQPTYPLGKDFSYFISNKKIEAFGLTPYKAGSNKLQDFRIILGKTTKEEVKTLITASYIPSGKNLANPVLDLFIMSDFARKLLSKDYSIPQYQDSLFEKQDMLRIQALENFDRYIYQPLQKGIFHEN